MADATTKNRPQSADRKTAGEASPVVNQKSKHPLARFREYADQRLASLNTALPPHISPDAFMSIVLTAIQKKPDLMACTPQSLWSACIDAANLGLLPDGVEGAIAPYGKNEEGKAKSHIATFMPMIGGYRKKAYEGGLIAKWEVTLVRARDHFDYRLGDDPFIDHKPYFGAENPGAVIGAYSIATLKDGSILRDVMSIYELNQIKSKSKALTNGPWKDPVFEPEMYRKTMGRRHFKQLPRSSALAKVIDHDDREFDLDHRSEDAIEDRRARRLTSTTAAFDQFSQPGPVLDNDDDFGSADGGEQTRDGDGDGEFAEGGDTDVSPDTQVTAASSAGVTATADPKVEAEDTSTQGQTDAAPRDHDEEIWDREGLPSTQSEYRIYAITNVRGWTKTKEFDTGSMKIIGVEAMKSWWKGKAERDLRTACGVSKDTFEALVEVMKTREKELVKGS